MLKTRRNDRVVRVERRRRIGTAGRLKAALWESEDSETPEHLVRRASQPHDSPRLGVRAPALALPRPWRRPAPRARRPRARLLPCHPAAQGVDVRSRDPDASDASRLGERANELERHLHGAGRSLRIPCGGRTRSRCRPAHAHEPSRAVIVLVAARTQIGCLINSEWRKHPLGRFHLVPQAGAVLRKLLIFHGAAARAVLPAAHQLSNEGSKPTRRPIGESWRRFSLYCLGQPW